MDNLEDKLRDYGSRGSNSSPMLYARLLVGQRHTALAHLEYPKETVCKICNKPLGQHRKIDARCPANTPFPKYQPSKAWEDFKRTYNSGLRFEMIKQRAKAGLPTVFITWELPKLTKL